MLLLNCFCDLLNSNEYLPTRKKSMNGNNIAAFKIKLGEKLLLSILDAIYFI